MKRSLIILLVIGLSKASAQIVSTVGGNGTAGYSGDGGLATAAQLNDIRSVAMDTLGNLFVSDLGNYAVRKISTSGVITTYAGGNTGGSAGDGGPATAAQLYQPQGLAFDKYNNLYICDSWNNVVRKVDASTGIISLFAGNYTSGYSGDGGPATSASLFNPYAIAFDTAGNAYIVDNNNFVIRKVNTSGIISTICGTSTAGFSGDGGPASSALLNYPTSIAIDTANNIFIGDDGNNRIRKISASTGYISTICGQTASGYSGDGGPAVSAQLDGISQIGFDKQGNLYIADHYNHVIRMIGTSGVINTIAGNGSSTPDLDGNLALSTAVSYPIGLVIDGAGNYYFSEYGSNRVRMVCAAPDSLSGLVSEPNANPVTAGRVYVYKQNLSHSGYRDTAGYANINIDGTYHFSNLPHGNYFVEAVPDTASYHNAVSSYFSTHANNYVWDSATIVTHYGCKNASNNGFNITITEMTPMTGTCTITGNVITPGGYGQRYGNNFTMGAPLKGVDVKLGRNPGATAAARTTTDASGNYQFVNVDTGSYFVFVDIPNFGRDTLWIPHVTSFSPISAGNDYCVDSILANPCSFTTQVRALSPHSLILYPNPAQDFIQISSSSHAPIIIYNMMGEAVLRRTDLTDGRVYIGELPAGIYTVECDGARAKFIKQ